MNKRVTAIARAAGVITATVGLIVGVTFAQLNTTAALTGVTVNSATAGLLVSNGGAYSASEPGFHVTGLIPGHGSGLQPFYLQNTGDTPLVVTVHVPAAPTATGFTNWANFTATFHSQSGGNDVTVNMQDLLNGQVALPNNPLPAGAQGVAATPGTVGNYDVTFDINPAAVTGSSASVGAFDLVFTGTAQ